MFDRLHKAFAGVAKSLGEKELREKDIDDVLFELEMSLLESDVASEVIDSIKADLKRDLIGTKVEKSAIQETIRSSLISSISSLFDSAGRVDLFGRINEKKEKGEPFLILFVGINGTGKTTSLAKVAHMLQKSKYSVVVAASDTFRAGAIEQLKEHTKRLNLKLVAQNYNSDPAAVARDAVLYAKAHRTDCVLIDTAGRMQTSKNLMEQIAKITKVVSPDLKIFVGDSLAGNDTVNQAREFFEHTRFDASILTKADADARGGAALSIAKVTSTPILYVGTGQEYADMRPFDKKMFLEIVFGKINDEDIKDTQGRADELPARMETPEDASQQQQQQQQQEEPPKQEEDKSADEPAKDSDIRPEIQPMAAAPQPPPEASLQERATSPQSPPPQQQPSPPPEPEPEPEPEEPADTQQNPELQEELQAQEQATEPEPDPTPDVHDDPFYGIADSDIADYSDKFDVPPPDNDKDARNLAATIRKWIERGRPEPGDGHDDDSDVEHERKNADSYSDRQETMKKDTTVTDEGEEEEEDGDNDDDDGKGEDAYGTQKEDKDGKFKKKRGMFGFFRR